MITTFRRTVAAFSLVALVSVIAAAPSNAADTPTGVGSNAGNATLLTLDYGNTIKGALLGETSLGSIDPSGGTPSATEILSPLNVSSVAIPALNALTVPSVQTKQPGGTASNSAGPIAVNTAALSGVIDPATLKSSLDDAGAKTSLVAQLANLQVVGGLVHLDSSSLNLGGLSSTTSSTASRSVSANGLTVLDLRGVLNLLGLDLSDLTLGELTSLLDTLGVLDQIPGNFANPASLTTAVTIAGSAVNDAQADFDSAQSAFFGATDNLNLAQLALNDAQAALTACVGCPGTQPALALAVAVAQAAVAVQQPIFDVASAALDAAQSLLDTVQGVLGSLLGNIADVLTSTPLLEVQGVQVGAVATAKDTVANSVATITGTINNVRVGGINLGAINANSTLADIQALAASATSQINTILTSISPALANLITVSLLQGSAPTPTKVGDYVQALAGITGVVATIAPPDLCAVFESLPTDIDNLPIPDFGSTPIPGFLASVGSTISPCPQAEPKSVTASPAVTLDELNLPVLTQPLTLKAASVNSASNFKVVAASVTPTTPTTPALPRTGMNETLLLIVGGLMAAVALGLRRMSTSD